MKNLFLILVLFNLNICLFAQPFGEAAPDFRIVKQDYENSAGEKSTTNFKYDHEGKLFKSFWSQIDETRSSVNFYEYNEKGYLVSAFREFSDGLSSFELFTYDVHGNKISEHFYRSDKISGSAFYQYEKNDLMQADFYNHKGWINGTVRYQYDEKMMRQNSVLMKDEKVVCLISYEYDSNNNLSKEIWDFEGKWNQTFYYRYERTNLKANFYSSPFLSNSGTYRISRENYTLGDEISGPSIYHYDEKGLLFKKEFIRSDGISTTTFYQYDSLRKLISSQRTFANGNIERFTYNYDRNENLILRSFYKGDSLAGFESYLYNSDGVLIKAYFQNLDNWLTGTISFYQNEFGEIESGVFKGENDLDATISYKYNAEGLLSEITWEFTSGKFQRYFFEYKLMN